MTLVFPKSLQNILSQTTVHLATCWQLTRTDSTVYRFTDHDTALVLSDGNTYSPAFGLDASAQQRKADLTANNLEMVGIIDSSAITDDDLRAGLFHGAEILERLVDWREPWVSNAYETKWLVQEVTWNGFRWEAQVVDLMGRLQKRTGRIVGRECINDLGDEFRGEVTTGCTVDTTAITLTGSVSAVAAATNRQRCETNRTEVDDYFKYGFLTFTSGNNNGITRQIIKFENTNGVFYFVNKFPYDIAVSDTFSVYPGCGKTPGYCKGVDGDKSRTWASAIEDFNGFPFTPGTDRMLRTPSVKNE